MFFLICILLRFSHFLSTEFGVTSMDSMPFCFKLPKFSILVTCTNCLIRINIALVMTTKIIGLTGDSLERTSLFPALLTSPLLHNPGTSSAGPNVRNHCQSPYWDRYNTVAVYVEQYHDAVPDYFLASCLGHLALTHLKLEAGHLH